MTDSIPASGFYDITQIGDISLSPDETHVAFVGEEFDTKEESRRRSLYLVPTDGSLDPYRLSNVGNAKSPVWSPDSKRLGFLGNRPTAQAQQVSSPARNDNRDGPDRQVWLFDLDQGGDARQITHRPDGVEEFDWSPDGGRLVVAARDPTDNERQYLEQRENGGPYETERLQHKYLRHGWLDTVTTYLFIVDIETNEERRLDDAIRRGSGSLMTGMTPKWSPNGVRIAFASNFVSENPDDTFVQDVYTITPEGNERTRWTEGDQLVYGFEWSPGGDRIAIVQRDPGNWYGTATALVADESTGEVTPLMSDLDRSIPSGIVPQWLDGDSLLTLIGDNGTTRFASLSPDVPAERVFNRQGDYRTITQFDLKGETVACVISEPGEGTDVFTLGVDDLDATRTDADPLVRLSSVNDEVVSAYPMPECRRINFESDGHEIEGLVYHPSDFDPDDPTPHPLLLKVHGGPQWYDAPRGIGCRPGGKHFDKPFFTSRGYLVLNVNYRGSTSYGAAFCSALRNNEGVHEVDDVLAGVDALVDRGWADPNRLYVTGFSWGAYVTGRTIIESDDFVAAAAEHGGYNGPNGFGIDDAHIFRTNQHPLPWERDTQDETDPESDLRMSVVKEADRVSTPTLITAGEEDHRCPPALAEQLFVSLRKLDVPSRLVVYPGEEHAVTEPDRAIHRLEAIEAWFERHTDSDWNDTGTRARRRRAPDK